MGGSKVENFKVAIIGGGAAGIACAKQLKEEGCEDFVLIDERDGMGGLWRFDAEEVGVMTNTRATSSRHFIVFSDHHMPGDWGHFVDHMQYVKYLESYAKANKLEQHTRYGRVAESSKLLPNGKWELEVKGKTSVIQETYHADYIVCATGLHNKLEMMDHLPGRTSFKGPVYHSGTLKNLDNCVGKKVLVLGMGESGGDIIRGLAKVAKSTTLSVRRGVVVMPQGTPGGTPADFDGTRAKTFLPKQLLHDFNLNCPGPFNLLLSVLYLAFFPVFMVYLALSGKIGKMGFFEKGMDMTNVNINNQGLDTLMILNFFNPMSWINCVKRRVRFLPPNQGMGLKKDVARMQAEGRPKKEYFGAIEKHSGALHNLQPFTKSPFFLEDVAAGRVKVECGIKGMTPTGAEFVDGTKSDYDIIILATGYKLDLTYLPHERTDLQKLNVTDLYMNIFHPELPLVFAGFSRPGVGAMPPIAEMHSRAIARVLTGKHKLPETMKLKKLIAEDKAKYYSLRPHHASRITGLVDYMTYMNRLATFIGCAPNLLEILARRDLPLLYATLFSPITSHQFRLCGPGAKPEVVRDVLVKEMSPVFDGRVYKHMLMFTFVRPILYFMSLVPGMGELRPFF